MHLPQSRIYIFGFILVAAGDNNNYFTNQLLVSWITELSEFNITFWQQSLIQQSAASQGNIYSKIHASDKVTHFTWTVQLLGFDLSYSNEFFLWVNPDGPDGFVSTYFNITEPTTTTATATVATATSINTHNLALPVSSASTSAVSSSVPTPSWRLTTTSKIALAVGIGIGIPVLCALGAIIWIKLRQSNNGNGNMNDNSLPGYRTGPPPGAISPWPVMQQQAGLPYQAKDIDPKELQQCRFSTNNRFELPNSPYR
ncbi:hypothetical protein PENDEC_c003G06630 [Penicillium decumbens]|uniref:Mid2 domain-containing protein n=1 Tax=Penicillium decumbens TaxID=69771 RepID=A0A1V6PK15_PENDC|nr:hypothetical protein PENDEC_c003G06630 [Penicillium decumbens]